ncbi:MAG TPA: helical backbone metal receptor [Herpetosiphonaceae bacterium]
MQHDDLGRLIDLPAPPQRIVSLVPSLTEFLFAIGAGDVVKGVTDYCVAPADRVALLPKLRGTKNPNRASIRVVNPDLIIANKEENRERDVAALSKAGFPVYVTDIESVDQARASLERLAALVGCADGAALLLAEIDAELAECRRLRPADPIPCAAAIWRDPWMLVGAGTYADDLLAQCGFLNVARQLEGRYPRVTLDELAALGPRLLLLPDEPYRFTEADLPDAASAAPRALLCDGTLLTWYGPRTAGALRWLRDVAGSCQSPVVSRQGADDEGHSTNTPNPSQDTFATPGQYFERNPDD